MDPTNYEVLLAEGLRKNYGPRPALRGLSFSLHAGRILGFLGPNGAGKTTSIRILTTMLEPDAGRFVVDGTTSDHAREIRHKIGVLPENLGFPKQITGIEYLTYFGQLYGRKGSDARARGLSLLEEVGLQVRAKSLVGTYSHGMKQRLGIARALVNDPVVVFLDEPTLGLDPRGQQELLSLVQRIARERHAGIVLCSHVLSEIERVCDDVIILMEGQVIATGSVDKVVRQTQGDALRVRVPTPSVAEAQQVLETIPKVVKVAPMDERAGWLGIQFENSRDEAAPEDSRLNNQILGALIGAEIPILGFESEGGRLQDVFLQLTEEGKK
jgi:ABC-2 type transport system ATP-binding protein